MSGRKWANKTIRERQEDTIERSHAAPSECLMCGVRLMPAERSAHRRACGSRSDVSPRDTWVSEEQLVRFVHVATLNNGARTGALRTRETEGGREFLLRDIEQLLDVLKWFMFATH